TSPNPGARWTFAVVGPVAESDMKFGPATLMNVRGVPNGSDPLMAWSAVVCHFKVMFAGWLRVGARSQSGMVTVKPRSATPDPPSLARTVAGKVPGNDKSGGARWMF